MDTQGHPVFWDDGTGSASKMFEVFTKSDGTPDMYRMCILRSIMMRRMHNLKEKLSDYYETRIFQHVIVMNLEHLSWMEFTEQITKNRAFHMLSNQELSDTFPEVACKIFFINSPWSVRFAYKVILPFIDPFTAQKINVLGSDYLDELTKFIDIRMIPKKYGGKGKWDIRIGNVPKSFPFQTNDELLPKLEQFDTV